MVGKDSFCFGKNNSCSLLLKQRKHIEAHMSGFWSQFKKTLYLTKKIFHFRKPEGASVGRITINVDQNDLFINLISYRM